MVTKRTPIRPRARARITDEMVDLYARGRALYATGDDERPEEEWREFLDILNELHRLIGFETWHIPDRILFEEGYEPRDDELEVARIRAALEAALAERSPSSWSAQ